MINQKYPQVILVLVNNLIVQETTNDVLSTLCFNIKSFLSFLSNVQFIEKVGYKKAHSKCNVAQIIKTEKSNRPTLKQNQLSFSYIGSVCLVCPITVKYDIFHTCLLTRSINYGTYSHCLYY